MMKRLALGGLLTRPASPPCKRGEAGDEEEGGGWFGRGRRRRRREDKRVKGWGDGQRIRKSVSGSDYATKSPRHDRVAVEQRLRPKIADVGDEDEVGLR